MNKKMKFLLIAFAAMTTSYSYAQRPTLGLGFEVGVPAGDLNNTQKIGVGGSANVAFPVGGGTALTLSAGYLSYSGDEIGSTKLPALNFIPFKAGVRHQFTPYGFYLEPQLGYTSINTPNSNTKAHGGFTYAAKAGYMINSKVDASARYEAVSLKNDVLYPQLVFRLGYNFGL